MGDKILLGFNNLRTVDVARSQRKIQEESAINITELVTNVNTKTIADNPQEQQESIHSHYQPPILNSYTFSSPNQYHLDTNEDVMERIPDEHPSSNNLLQDLSNENPGKSTEDQCFKYDSKTPEKQQFTSLRFDYNLLAEDISPHYKNSNPGGNNWTSPTSFEADASSNAENTALDNTQTGESTSSVHVGKDETVADSDDIPNGRGGDSEDLHSNRMCSHGHLWSRLTIPLPTKSYKMSNTKSVKIKPSTPDNNPQELKRKPQISASENMNDLEVFVSNCVNPSLSWPKNSILKIVTLLLDIVQGIGDEANTLTTMTGKREVDSRVLQCSIKMILDRMKNEADIVTTNSSKTLNTKSVKGKQSILDNNPQETKRKPLTRKNMNDWEVFVSNCMEERHSSLCWPKSSSLKMVTLLLDIVQGIGDEANILATMTGKREVDPRVLQYSIKLCLNRTKSEADIATKKEK